MLGCGECWHVSLGGHWVFKGIDENGKEAKRLVGPFA